MATSIPAARSAGNHPPSQVAEPVARQTTVRLRPYQTDALAAIAEAEASGIRRALAILPTGTGKTVIFAEHIRRRGGRALVLVHGTSSRVRPKPRSAS